MTVEELLLYDSTTRKKAPTEVRAILRYMKKKGGENHCLVTGIEIVPDMVRIFRGVSGTVSALLI